MTAGVRTKADQRLVWFGGFLLLWAGLIFVRLFFLQVVRHEDYASKARGQQEEETEIAAPRGTILDRTGQVLAESVSMDSIYIDPLHVPDLQVASEILSGILNLDRGALYGRMQSYFDNQKGFMWVARKIEPEQAEQLRSLHFEWIRFAKETRRHYPRGTLAAHVIGSVDGEENGAWGLEKSLDDDLHGLPGAMRVLTDAKGRGIDSQLEEEPRPGASLTISIDERVQFPAEVEIARAVQDAHAESGSVVALDPYHGDVLAMASYPPFDPNQPPARGERASVRFNHALSVPFEPGSVFKVITLSAALETTNLRPDTMINCGNGTITLFGRTIHEAHHGYGTIPMAMVLAKSSNIGAIQIGMRVGQNNLYEYVRRFGFGTRTGLPLPAESPGMVRKLSRWGATSLSSVAMGHEVGVTTLQLAQACAVVANGGLLVPPRLILQKGQTAAPVVAPRRVLQPATAITMRQMMEGVVLYGTGKRAKLDGYSVGGKTGSAQIYDFATRHYTHSYNASFMGFAPVTNPAIVVVVTLNGTHGSSGFGGAVAAPVFRVVAGEALRVLDVPKDLPDAKPEKPEKQADLDDVSIADLGSNEPSILEEAGQISGQPGREPATGAAVRQVSNVTAPAPPAQRASQAPRENGLAGGSARPTTPNFIGLSKRAVLALSEAQGVPVLTVGIGIVRAQHPPPGAALRAGERIRVELLR